MKEMHFFPSGRHVDVLSAQFLELSRTNLLSSVKSVPFIIINTKMSRDVEREREKERVCVRAYQRERERGRMENR